MGTAFTYLLDIGRMAFIQHGKVRVSKRGYGRELAKTVPGIRELQRYQECDVFKTNGVRLICMYYDLCSAKNSQQKGLPDCHGLDYQNEIEAVICLDIGERYTTVAFYMPTPFDHEGSPCSMF